MTYEEARAFAAAGELRNRMKRDPTLAIKITEKAIVERDRLNAVNAELLAALEIVANSGKFSCFDDTAWDQINNAIAKAGEVPCS